MKKSTKAASALALVSMLALAGCSGGSDSGGANSDSSNPGGSQIQADNEVPESAGASSSAFIAFLKSMMIDDETTEPMKMREGWAVPADDTGDPAAMS